MYLLNSSHYGLGKGEHLSIAKFEHQEVVGRAMLSYSIRKPWNRAEVLTCDFLTYFSHWHPNWEDSAPSQVQAGVCSANSHLIPIFQVKN